MKKVSVVGTAAFILTAPLLFAQQPGGPSTTDRQGSTPASQAGTARPKASAPAAGASGQATGERMAAADHSFVMEAAMGSAAEVELGNLAGQKAQSEAVKQFAKRMVTDHGKASEELKTLAQTKNMPLPTGGGAQANATKDRLSKLSGAAFDRAYMQNMVADHRKDVAAFERESKSGKDGDVKAWAAKTLPTLQEHLKMAEEASRGAVGTSGSSPARSGSGATAAPSGRSASSPGTATGSSSPR